MASKTPPKSPSLPQGSGGETQQRGEPVLTTNHGVPISDNQNSLKAGARGPVLLEDFVLREKIPAISFDELQALTGAPLHVEGEVADLICPEL